MHPSHHNTGIGSSLLTVLCQEAVKMGLMGGKYKPLTDHDIEQIHQTALDVLENIGMGDRIPEFKEAALKSGCTINDKGRIIRDNKWGTQEEHVVRRDLTINSIYYDPFAKEIIALK